MPLFAEVVRAFPKHRINVDLKGAASVDAMLALVRELGAEGRVTLASFQTSTAVRVRRRGYGGETGLSQGEVIALLGLPALAFRQLPFTGTAVQVPVKQGAIRFDRIAFIAKCHSLGLRVDYWTIDDPAEAARLLALGADGIMTNDPAAIRAAVPVATRRAPPSPSPRVSSSSPFRQRRIFTTVDSCVCRHPPFASA